MKYSHLSIPTLLTLALTGAGCKSDCEKAIDHTAHLAWVQNQKDMVDIKKDLRKELPHWTPEFEAEVAKYTPNEEQMLPSMRKVVAQRFGERCKDPALTKCVLAAKDMGAVAECEHPMTPAELEEANKALQKLRDVESAEAKQKAAREHLKQ